MSSTTSLPRGNHFDGHSSDLILTVIYIYIHIYIYIYSHISKAIYQKI